MSYPGYGNARYQDPSLHWLDLPEGDPEEWEDHEDQEPERTPLSTFTDRQTLFVAYEPKTVVEFSLFGGALERQIPWRLREYPVHGDEHHLGSPVNVPLHREHKVYGYVLQRNPEFEDSFYGWGAER
jgi:hypothetical protein